MDGFGSFGDELQKMVAEEQAVEDIGARGHEIGGPEGVGAVEGEGRESGIGDVLLEVERERGGGSGLEAFGVGEEEGSGLQGVVGSELEGVVGDEQTAHGNVFEASASFKDGRFGVATFGWTVADEEAGDVACDEVLVEFFKQIGETAVGPTSVV